MGAPGTIVEGAEKPVMRAVAVEVRREVKVVRRARKRISVGLKWESLDVAGVEAGSGWMETQVDVVEGRVRAIAGL